MAVGPGPGQLRAGAAAAAATTTTTTTTTAATIAIGRSHNQAVSPVEVAGQLIASNRRTATDKILPSLSRLTPTTTTIASAAATTSAAATSAATTAAVESAAATKRTTTTTTIWPTSKSKLKPKSSAAAAARLSPVAGSLSLLQQPWPPRSPLPEFAGTVGVRPRPSAANIAGQASPLAATSAPPTSAPPASALAVWLPLPPALGLTLVSCAMLLASLVVLYYLYLNRKLCFHGIAGGPDKRKYSDYSSNTLDDTFYYEDISASSDSDEHLINNENLDTADPVDHHQCYQQQRQAQQQGLDLHRDHAVTGDDRRIDSQPRQKLIERPCSVVSSLNEASEDANLFTAELLSGPQRGAAKRSYQSLQTCYEPVLTSSVSVVATLGGAGGNDAVVLFNEDDDDDVDNDNNAQKITSVNERPFNVDNASGGVIKVLISHDALARRLVVNLIQLKRVPPCKSLTQQSGKTSARTGSYRVKVTALSARHAGRFKQGKASKVKQADQQGNCTFNEDLVFSRITSESLASMQLRFRIHAAHERLTRRQRLLSEALISLRCARLREPLQIALESKVAPGAGSGGTSSESEVSDCSMKSQDSSTGSLNSLQSPHSPQHVGLASSPELLIGLAYNGTTGRLSVEIIGGSHLGVLPGVPHVKSCTSPDTFVKLCLVSSSGQEIASSKTSVRKGQADPVYKETFVFQVALFQLCDVTLILSAYKRSSMKRKQLVGWLSFGMNPSSDAQLVHWADMKDARGEQVARWNTLIQNQG